MAGISTILVYLLTLVLGVSGPAAGMEVTVNDIQVISAEETFDLGVDGYFASTTDGTTSTEYFELSSGDDRSFPTTITSSEDAITLYMEGMSKALQLSTAAMAGDFASQLGDVSSAYKELISTATGLSQEEIYQEMEALSANLDRGEPSEDELEFDDGAVVPVQHWSYDVSGEQMSDFMDAFVNGGALGQAYGKYMSALLAATDADADITEYLHDLYKDVSVAVDEYANQEEDLHYTAMSFTISVEETSLELYLHMMQYASAKTVDASMEAEGLFISVSAESVTEENGVSTLVDAYIESGYADDATYNVVERTEETEDEAVEEAEEEAIEEGGDTGINNLDDLENLDVAIIGGADVPTDIYVNGGSDVLLHLEAFVENPDAEGNQAYTGSFYTEVLTPESDLAMGIDAEGKITADAITAHVKVSFIEPEMFIVSGNVQARLGDDIEITLPDVESVSVSDEDYTALFEALGELETVASADAEKLSEIEGVQRLKELFSSFTFTNTDAYDVEYDTDYEIITQVDTVAEAAEIFGAEIPFGDTELGMSASYIDVGENYVYIWYGEEDNYDKYVSCRMSTLYADDIEIFYTIDEAALAQVTEPVLRITGSEDGEWYIIYAKDGIEYEITMVGWESAEDAAAYAEEVLGR